MLSKPAKRFFLEDILINKEFEMDLKFKAPAFNPKQFKQSRAYKGKYLTKPLKITKHRVNGETVNVATIKKENIGVLPYQRSLDTPRSSKIGKNWNPDCSLAIVQPLTYNGKTYFAIDDGQQRNADSPGDEVLAVVAQDRGCEHPVFITANESGKNLSPDGRFWTNKELKEETHTWLYDLIVSYGLKPGCKDGDEGKLNKKNGMFQGMANYYEVLEKIHGNVKSEFKKRMTAEEMKQESRKRFEKILEILYSAYGSENFITDGGRKDYLSGMRKFLNTHDWQVIPKDMIKALKLGYYKVAPNGQAKIKGQPGDTKTYNVSGIHMVHKIQSLEPAFSKHLKANGGEGCRSEMFEMVFEAIWLGWSDFKVENMQKKLFN